MEMVFRNSDGGAIVASSNNSNIHKLALRGAKLGSNASSQSDSSELLNGDLDAIPILTKQLTAVRPIKLLQSDRAAVDRQEYGICPSNTSSSDDDWRLTGRSRLSPPELPRRTEKGKSTKHPSFL